MRILLFLRSLLHGGTERQVIVLARGLKARGHEVRIVTLYGGHAFADDLTAAGIKHDPLGKLGRFDLFAPHRKLVQLARSWPADVVYSFLPAQNLAAVLLSLFYPQAKLVIGVRAAGLDLQRYDWLAGLSYRLEPWFARRADLVISNSAAGELWCEERGFPKGKLLTIPNGVETDKFRFDDAARRRLRENLGLAVDAVLVTVVARLDVMKGHPVFLHAAAQLAREYTNMVFACVGNGTEEYLADLMRLASELDISDRVIWLPAQKDVRAVFSASDIGVLPSIFGEGFPNILVEGMACGLPMVATDTGDARRIVNGYLPIVPPSNATELAGAISAVASNLHMASILREKLRAHIQTHYSAEALAAATESALMSLER
ncbi:MAG: glycosyltransferase [Alphaproteobacteria bacterium]|nr:glycosyltransferase [Alphaproteobacteria bacterium]